MSQPAHPGTVSEKGVAAAPGGDASGSGGLPKPAISAAPKRKIHPTIIIAIWIALSSSVIVYNKCVYG